MKTEAEKIHKRARSMAWAALAAEYPQQFEELVRGFKRILQQQSDPRMDNGKFDSSTGNGGCIQG